MCTVEGIHATHCRKGSRQHASQVLEEFYGRNECVLLQQAPYHKPLDMFSFSTVPSILVHTNYNSALPWYLMFM